MATDTVLVKQARDGFLMDAVKKGDYKDAAKWIGLSADVNMADKNGRTPLWYAASVGEEKIAHLLIISGAHIDAADEDGMTPLHTAIQFKNFIVADLLLKEGANIHFQEADKVAPLHTAFFSDLNDNGTERLRYVLDKGADIHTPLREQSLQERRVLYAGAAFLYKILDSYVPQAQRESEEQARVEQARKTCDRINGKASQAPRKFRFSP